MKNFVREGEKLLVTSAGAESDDLIKVGHGIWGVAVGDANADDEVVIKTCGVFTFTKATGYAASAGDVAFFDYATDGRLESFSASATYAIGFYAEDAASGDTEAKVILDPDAAQAAIDIVYIGLSLTANGTWEFVAPVMFGCLALGGAIVAPDAWASAGGTVLFSLKKTNDAGNSMLSTATVDLEGISDETYTDLTMTSTVADRTLSAGGKIYGKIVSNNADATGPDVQGGQLALVLQRT